MFRHFFLDLEAGSCLSPTSLGFSNHFQLSMAVIDSIEQPRELLVNLFPQVHDNLAALLEALFLGG